MQLQEQEKPRYVSVEELLSYPVSTASMDQPADVCKWCDTE